MRNDPALVQQSIPLSSGATWPLRDKNGQIMHGFRKNSRGALAKSQSLRCIVIFDLLLQGLGIVSSAYGEPW